MEPVHPLPEALPRLSDMDLQASSVETKKLFEETTRASGGPKQVLTHMVLPLHRLQDSGSQSH